MSARTDRKPRQSRSSERTDTVAHVLPDEPSCILRLAGGDTYVVDLNVRFAQRFDLDLDLALSRGRSVRDLLQAEAALDIMRAVRRCITGRRTVKASVSAARRAGAKVVRLNLRRIDNDLVLATMPDMVVFGRRQSDKDKLETLGAVDGGAIYVTDMQTRSILFATERVNEIIGYSRETIEGLVADPSAPGSEFFQALFHPDDAAAVAIHFADLRRAHDDAVVTLLCRVRHATAGWRWIEARSRVLSRARDGSVERVVGFAVDITEQRQLHADLQATSFALLRAEENERRRIAREIHDSTAQHLVALDLGFARLEKIVRNGPEGVREWVDEMRGLTRTAHQELRVATFALHPPELEQSGLADTLRDLIRGFGRRTGLEVEFHVEGTPRPIAPAAELAVLRVSQEALLNTHKHARAKVAKLRLIYEETAIVVEIEDDGVGAAMGQAKLWDAAGVGLQSMKARLAALGGVLSIVSGRRGFMVRASIPQSD
jgi:PAS domain S-box-containing protein